MPVEGPRRQPKNVLSAVPGQQSELQKLRTPLTRTFMNPDGTFSADVYSIPVNYKDIHGNLKQINNTIKAASVAGFSYENTANRFNIKFAQDTQSGKLINITFPKGKSIDITPLNRTYQLGLQSNTIVDYDETNSETSLRYTLQGDLIKEEIIYYKNPATNTYSFGIDVAGIKLEPDIAGRIWALDTDTGERQFYFKKSFARDAKENVTENVDTSLANTGDGYIITITVDADWLANAAFPVVVDPTIVTSVEVTESQYIQDTFISSQNSTTNYYLNNYLHTGNLAGYGTLITLIRFAYLPSLPPGAKITSAYLNMFMYLGSTGGTTVSAYKAITQWTSSTVTWATQPTYEEPALIAGVTGAPNSMWQIDITKAANDWYNGVSSNYGIMLKATTESDPKISFFSADSAGNPIPKLTINYEVDALGVEDFFGYHGNVNVYNGNLVLTATDVALPGRGVSISVSRTYNSRSGEVSSLGNRWRINQTMRLDFAPDEGVVKFTDGDGLVKFYTRKPDGTYAMPIGVYSKLYKSGGVFIIEDKSGIKYYFTTAGRLDKIVDTNNNTTSLTYLADGNINTITDPSARTITFNYTGGVLASITGNDITTVEYAYIGNNLASVSKKDSSGNILDKDTYGYDTSNNLISVTDYNNNVTTIGYDYPASADRKVNLLKKQLTINNMLTDLNTAFTYVKISTGRMATITDPKGKVVEYKTNNLGNVESVTADKTGLNLTTTFTWDQSHNLVQVVPPKGNALSDVEGYKHVFDYDDSGNNVSIESPYNYTTNSEYYDNNDLKHSTDYAGRPQQLSYDANTRNVVASTNPLFSTSIINRDSYGNIVAQTDPVGVSVNAVINQGFEYTGAGIPKSWFDKSTGGAAAQVSDIKQNGTYAVKLTSTGTGNAILESDYFDVKESYMYNISCYVRTQGVGAANAGAVVDVYFYNAGKASTGSQYDAVNLAATSGTTGTFVRKGNRIKSPVGARYAKMAIKLLDAGTAWFDDLQMDEGSVVNNYNLVSNPSFELDVDGNGVPDSWASTTLAAGEGVIVDAANAEAGSKYFIYKGTTGTKTLSQSLSAAGEIATPLYFSGFASVQGASASGGVIQLLLNIWYNGQKVESFTAPFSKTAAGWQFAENTIATTKKFDKLELAAQVVNQAGATVWFDDFKLRAAGAPNAVLNEYNNLYNGSFELDRDGTDWPDDWPTYRLGATVANDLTWMKETNANQAYNGDRMIRVYNVPAEAGVRSNLFYEPIKAGATYTVIAAIKTEGVTGSGAAVKIELIQAPSTKLGEKVSKIVKGTNDWTRVYVTLTPNDLTGTYSSATHIRVSAGAVGQISGNIYIDSVRLIERAIETSYIYDSKSNYVTSVTNQLGDTTSFVPDNRGNITQITDPKLNVYSFNYDKLDRITRAKNPKGLQTLYYYDNNSNLKQVDNYTSTGTYISTAMSMEFNELDLPKKINDPKWYATNIEYDQYGNVTDIKYPNTKQIHNVYDSLGRLSQTNYTGDSTVWDYVYDQNNNITSITKNSANSVVYDYDKLDRVTSETYKAGSTVISTVNYVYNPGSEVTSITYSALPTSDTVVAYEYDQAGNNTAATGPNGTYSAYMHDEQGRLKKVFLQKNFGNSTSRSTTTMYYYDDIGRINRLITEKNILSTDVDKSSNVMADFSYEYDDNGNRTKETDNLTGKHTEYLYDVINQLTDEKYFDAGSSTPTTTISYQYDLLGNILQKTVQGGASTTFTYNVANELLTRNGNTDFSYDANGNLTNDGGWIYTYNAENQLINVQNNGAQVANYEYNAAGLRTKKVTSTKTELYYYVGDKLVYITDGANKLKYFFKRDASGRLQQMVDYSNIPATPAKTYWYIRDAHGNVVALADESGNKIVNFKYDAWGNLTNTPEAVTTANGELLRDACQFRYSGYQFDPETGLYYLKARYYSPLLMRFLTRDVLLSTNRYVYAANNPVNFNDPRGASAQVDPGSGGARVRPKIDYLGGAAISDYNRHIQINVAHKKQSSNLPVRGVPNSKVKSPDGKQEREYGPDGRAKRDTDYGHPEHHPELPSPHAHDWDWSKNPPRGPAYAPIVIRIIGFGLVVLASIGVAVVLGDDVSGVGVLDDTALAPLAGSFAKGLQMLF